MNMHIAKADRGALTITEAGPYRWIADLRAAWSEYRAYIDTLTELEAMSDRDLADIGISRHSIRDIAREAVYGK